MELPRAFAETRTLEIEAPHALEATLDSAKTSPPNPLPCVVPEQKKDEWCWAAVCAGVQGCYEPPVVEQCLLAGEVLGGFDCCNDPSICNNPMFLVIALSRLGFLQPPALLKQVEFEVIRTEIDGGRPICCFIDYGSEVGHFIIISGYDRATTSVAVLDPAPGGPHSAPKFIPFASFKIAYGDPSGRWKETYKTKRRA